jgi:hypothetical protein
VTALTGKFVRFPFALLALGLVSFTSGAADSPDASLDIIQYKSPPKWVATDPPNYVARYYTAPDSNAQRQAYIVIVLAPPKGRLDLRADFEAMAQQMTQGGRVVEAGELSASKTRQGFDALAQTRIVDAPDGRRLRLRLVSANVQGRLASFGLTSSDGDLYERHQKEMDDLLASVSFNVAAVVAAGAPPAQAGPQAVAQAKAEYDALERQKQDLLKKLTEIDARQRQLAPVIGLSAPAAASGLSGLAAGVGAAAAPAGSAPSAGVPRPKDEQLLSQAREGFEKVLEKRRKPHTILGDILTLEGKPIPDVVSYELYVGGTTVAAERTHFNLDVDKNGHFEQQVPDGLYRIQIVCMVTLGGHQVPVDLIALDGKPNVDQSSTPGIVKDFRLVLTGLKPGEDPKSAVAYFGGALTVNDGSPDTISNNLARRHPGTRLRLTLAPSGALADGSAAQTLTFDVDPREAMFGAARVRGVPMGVYRLGASLVAPSGATVPLRCARKSGDEYSADVEIFWERTAGGTDLREDVRIFVKE